jgi:biotin synthase-like enzyme
LKTLRDLLIAANESCNFKVVAKTKGVRITNRCVRVPLCYYCNYMNEPVYVLSVDDAVNQIKALKNRGADRITLVSGWLGYRNEMAVPYLRAIKSEMPDLIVSGAFGPISKQSLKKLKAAGLDQYGCNLESAPEVLLKIKETNDIPERIETLKNAREIGLQISTGFIIGVEETEEQLMDLLNLIKHVNPDSIFMSPFEAYPNTSMKNYPIPSLTKLVEAVAKTKLTLKNKTLGFRIIRRSSVIPIEFMSLLVFTGVSLVAPVPEITDMSVESFRKLLKSCIQNPAETEQNLLRKNVNKEEIREFRELTQSLRL